MEQISQKCAKNYYMQNMKQWYIRKKLIHKLALKKILKYLARPKLSKHW